MGWLSRAGDDARLVSSKHARATAVGNLVDVMRPRPWRCVKILQRHTDVAAEASVLAMIGTFDPLSNAHFELFDVMSGAAAERGLTPLIVVLFPSPAMFVNP